MHGVVVKPFYMGSAIYYDVVLDGTEGMLIEVRQGNAPGIENYGVGERVRVRWNPHSTTVLAD